MNIQQLQNSTEPIVVTRGAGSLTLNVLTSKLSAHLDNDSNREYSALRQKGYDIQTRVQEVSVEAERAALAAIEYAAPPVEAFQAFRADVPSLLEIIKTANPEEKEAARVLLADFAAILLDETPLLTAEEFEQRGKEQNAKAEAITRELDALTLDFHRNTAEKILFFLPADNPWDIEDAATADNILQLPAPFIQAIWEAVEGSVFGE
jgi:hypothetical protein